MNLVKTAKRTSKAAAARELEKRVVQIAGIMDEGKAEEIAILDLRGVTDTADFFIIATVRARTQMRGITHKIYGQLKEEGFKPVAPIEDESPRWTIIDYGHIVVHLFDPEARKLYQLEQVWGDAGEIDWREG
ncbi:ribosome silencing factor, partial [Candidatus Sumerlaeota bacterium]|nr:ribosome silencing factor [Candidatus Sumerlaeota bacterium]